MDHRKKQKTKKQKICGIIVFSHILYRSNDIWCVLFFYWIISLNYAIST